MSNFKIITLEPKYPNVLVKRVWKSILESELEVDLEDTEYKPSGFHTYKN